MAFKTVDKRILLPFLTPTLLVGGIEIILILEEPIHLLQRLNKTPLGLSLELALAQETVPMTLLHHH